MKTKETKLSANEVAVVADNNGLHMYLNGLLEGKKATERSNLYNLEGKTELLEPDQILERWLKQLDCLKSKDSDGELVFQFDSHQTEKWGPQGGVAPISEILEEVVLPTFGREFRNDKLFKESEWLKAKEQFRKKLFQAGCHSLSPVPYGRVIEDMADRDTLESNSGWPDFTRRKLPEVRRAAIRAAEDGSWRSFPAIALFRNYNQKTRLVWMFPMSTNLVEGSFVQPLQQRLIASNDTYWSPWRGFEHVRELISRSYVSGNCLSASDFSKTDEHFSFALTMEVYDVIKYCFQPRYRELLLDSLENMHHIPLVIGPETELCGWHGVASGSVWTNFLETLFDQLFATYVSLKLRNNRKSKTEVQGLCAIGDDMSWITQGYSEDWPAELESLASEFGLQTNAEKVTNDEEHVKFLQRLFIRGYNRPDGLIRGIYPTIRALKSLVYPEKFHNPKDWSKDMEAVRAIMILENCVDHPLYEEFVKFVAKGDPNLQVVARMSRQQLDELQRNAKSLRGLTSTYNQEKRSARLSDFETVQVLAKI